MGSGLGIAATPTAISASAIRLAVSERCSRSSMAITASRSIS